MSESPLQPASPQAATPAPESPATPGAGQAQAQGGKTPAVQPDSATDGEREKKELPPQAGDGSPYSYQSTRASNQQEDAQSSKRPKAPTRRLAGRPSHSTRVGVPSVDEWVEMLNHHEADCTLYVECLDEALLEAVGWEIVEHEKMAKLQRRELTSRKDLRETDFADLLSFPESLSGDDGDPNLPVILIVRVNDPAFLRSIFDDQPTIRGAQPKLWELGSRVIVLLYPAATAHMPVSDSFAKDAMFWRIASSPVRAAESQLPPFEDILRTGRGAERALLFLGGFVCPLSHHFVDRFMECLGNQREKTGGKLADGTAEMVLVKDHWQEYRRDIVARCGLKWQSDERGRILDFPSQTLRNRSREVLWEDFDVVLDFFDRLHLAGIIFPVLVAEDASDEIQDRLIDLAAEVVRRDSGGHGAYWLSRIVQDLVEELQKRTEAGGADNVLKHWFLGILSAHQRRVFCSHIASLCANLLISEPTAQLAENFLRKLLQQSSDAAWEILRQLRGAMRQERFHKWTQDLLNQAPLGTKKAILQSLVEYAITNPRRLVQQCQLVKSWLPEDGKSFDQWKQSEQLCVAFPVPLLAALVGAARDDGVQSHALPLSPDPELGDPIPLLAEWLLHPQLEQALHMLGDGVANPLRSFALCTADLAQIAAEKQEAVRAESEAMVRRLAEAVLRSCKPPAQLQIKKVWKALADELLKEAGRVSAVEALAGKREVHMTRWNAVMALCSL